MKQANGFGSVYKLQGKRRKPWAAAVTTGWTIVDGKAKQHRHIVGYFATKKEALNALALYNATSTTERAKIDFRACLDIYVKEVLPKLSERTQEAYKTAIARTERVWNRDIESLRLRDIQDVVNVAPTRSSRDHMRCVLAGVYDVAIRREYIEPGKREMLRYIDLGTTSVRKIERTVFSAEEVQKLWDEPREIIRDLALVLLYTGMRIGEACDMKIEDVNIEKRTLYVRKSKTASGIRTIPICDRIFPLITALVAESKGYLLTPPWGRHLLKSAYERRWREKFGTDGHHSHDCRHSFITRSVELGYDARIVKSVDGHADSSERIEAIYTHISDATKLEVYRQFDYC